MTIALAALAIAMPSAAVTPPGPLAGSSYAGSLAASYDGAQIRALFPLSYGGAACRRPQPGHESVTMNAAGDLVLWSDGTNNACAAIRSPHLWKTGVFEVRFSLPGSGRIISDWPAVWFTGPQWPLNGEADLVEGLNGTDQASYHWGPACSPPGCTVYSKGTGSASPSARLPVYSPRIGPGWHTLDYVWAPSWGRVFYDGKLFTIFSGPWFRPGFEYLVIDITEGFCNSGTSGWFCGGPRASAHVAVRYVRAWRFR